MIYLLIGIFCFVLLVIAAFVWSGYAVDKRMEIEMFDDRTEDEKDNDDKFGGRYG